VGAGTLIFYVAGATQITWRDLEELTKLIDELGPVNHLPLRTSTLQQLNTAGNKMSNDFNDRRAVEQRVMDGERARENAERRREQEELHRRLGEEGRQGAETLRSGHEEFRQADESDRVDSEHVRHAQEGSRELAELAREAAENMREAAKEARAAANATREALADLKDLAQRQRLVLDRQEKAVAMLEARLRNSDADGRSGQRP